MIAVKETDTKNIKYTSKLELYRLIGEGYRAMEEGRESTIEEVEERIRQIRKDPFYGFYNVKA